MGSPKEGGMDEASGLFFAPSHQFVSIHSSFLISLLFLFFFAFL